MVNIFCKYLMIMVEVPGFEPGCLARRSIRNNDHPALGVVWKLSGRSFAQS
jgi:hypothetical protein